MGYYSYQDFSKFDHDFEKAEAVIGYLKEKLEKRSASESIPKHLINDKDRGPDEVEKYIKRTNSIHEDTRKIARLLEEVLSDAKKAEDRREDEQKAA